MTPSALSGTPQRGRPSLTPKELLERLVAFHSVSRNSNLPLVDWTEEYLTGWGARCRRTWSDDGTKANLLATFGPEGPGGVLLSGHTDVVPAEEPGWESDPFQLAARGNRLYGRGTADMKGFLAVALSLVPEIAERSLGRPLQFALSYDEEVGCVGAPRMIADLVEAGIRPEIAIVGEPTDMRVVVAHKSIHLFRTRVTGVEAHSSQPHLGAGAIMAAGRLIDAIWRIGEEARAHADSESRFEPPWTTVQVGLIDGGTAVNILPGECTFVWEYRSLPGEDPDRIPRLFKAEMNERVLPALREFAPEAGIETETISRAPPLAEEAASAAEACACDVLGEAVGTGRVVSYGTEGGQFQEAGISTVVCGPGSIDQAHRANEFVEMEQLEKCESFLRGVIERVRDDG